MESLIPDDSPLAAYLEGEGTVDYEDNQFRPTTPPSSPDSISFAPQGPPKTLHRVRRKSPTAIEVGDHKGASATSRIHDSCSKALNSRLGCKENAQFLERFRYTIITSGLLDAQNNVVGYSVRHSRQKSLATCSADGSVSTVSFTNHGLLGTGVIAFLIAASIAWARNILRQLPSIWQSCLVLSIFLLGGIATYAYLRRRWLHSIRRQAVEWADEFVSQSHASDAALRAALALIQEVELTSRGYRISTPLPPVTRLEEQTQSRRCIRLRRVLSESLRSLIPPFVDAYTSTRPLAVTNDLERYYDMYEISRADIEEIDVLFEHGYPEDEDSYSLKALKLSTRQLQTARSLFLCSLLALDADGGKPDFSRWTHVSEILRTLDTALSSTTIFVENILDEQDTFPVPPTHATATPQTPSRERIRTQMRKFSALSSGIRGLSAKMHLLREESDVALESSAEDVAELTCGLLTQYDGIGADLRLLVQEWEEGRVALTSSIDKSDPRRSMSSNGLLSPRSITPTSSIGGLVAVEGGPADAFRILNGEIESALADSGEEEIFEAVALPMPKQRSNLTREERIAKMKEDRVLRERSREKADASTKMVRELETVIRMRPQGKGNRRATALC